MLQCLEPSRAQAVITGSNPPDTPFHTPLGCSPVDDHVEPRFSVRGHAPCDTKLPSFSYTRCSGAFTDSAIPTVLAAPASPEPEGIEDSHLAHVNSRCSVTAGWLQDSALSASATEDTLIQPSSGGVLTFSSLGDRADNRPQATDSGASVTSAGNHSVWETNPCFNQRGSWDTESGGLQDGPASGAVDEAPEESLDSQDAPWEGSCGDEGAVPLEQQMWQSAASADEQLQEVEKLQEQLLWYQQAVTDSNRRLAIADAGR
ncbi:MAG: hypothetical protein WDW38_009572 [Sanguina aurantia]